MPGGKANSRQLVPAAKAATIQTGSEARLRLPSGRGLEPDLNSLAARASIVQTSSGARLGPPSALGREPCLNGFAARARASR